MMTIAQRVSFELVPVDSSASGFADAHSTAAAARGHNSKHRRSRSLALLVFGVGNRLREAQAVTMQLVGDGFRSSTSFRGVDH